MQNEEVKEMFRLCALIQTEHDPAKFAVLLDQLNRLLARKEKRLAEKLQDPATQS